MAEEVGVAVKVGRYLGAVEHLWFDRAGGPRYEINELVEINWRRLDTREDPVIQAAMRWLGSPDLTP
jgi:hypothetical protein